MLAHRFDVSEVTKDHSLCFNKYTFLIQTQLVVLVYVILNEFFSNNYLIDTIKSVKYY